MNANNLSKSLHEHEIPQPIQRTSSGKILLFIVVVGIVSIFAFKPFSTIVAQDAEIVSEGFGIYLICAIAIMLSAPMLLIDNVFLLLKKPKIDNFIRITTLATNAILGVILIPRFGIYGAAMGLAAGILINAILLRILIRKHHVFQS